MNWPKPVDLMLAYRNATPSEWRRHLKKLGEAGYPDIKKLEALVDRKRNTDPASDAVHDQGRGGEKDGSGGFDLVRDGG